MESDSDGGEDVTATPGTPPEGGSPGSEARATRDERSCLLDRVAARYGLRISITVADGPGGVAGHPVAIGHAFAAVEDALRDAFSDGYDAGDPWGER